MLYRKNRVKKSSSMRSLSKANLVYDEEAAAAVALAAANVNSANVFFSV
jgi:hypothetical protein